MKRVVTLVTSVLVLGAFVAIPSLTIAQTKSLDWERLDTEIAVEPNGDLLVTETNVIPFTEGVFTFGFREFDLSRTTGIVDVRVSEGDIPLELETEQSENALLVKYYLASPAERETRTITLRYRVRGALRYYPDGDQVWWKAVYADRSGFAVRNARVTVQLPPGAQAEAAEVYGVRASVQGLGESIVVARALEPIPNGREMEIRVQFPHGVVSGVPAAWQRAFDERQRFVEEQQPLFDAVSLSILLVVLFGGPALAAVIYITRGRDPNVGLIAEYLTEPPDLSPGLAGTLQNERANVQDIVATLVDLARREVIALREVAGKPQTDWQISPGTRLNSAELAPFERVLLNELGVRPGWDVSISDLRSVFYRRLAKIKEAMCDELVRRGYYNTSPARTRSAYRMLATVLWAITFVGSLIGCVVMFFVLVDLNLLAVCLPATFGVTAASFSLIAPHMPVRTRAGAEMRMRVAAFKRYLQSIETYTALDKHTELFERYLPWAIALGLRQSWMSKFRPLPVPPPTWYQPYPVSGESPLLPPDVDRPMTTGVDAPGTQPRQIDISQAARTGGGFEGFERSLGSSFALLERNLSSMFDALARNMESRFTASPSSSSSSSDGGWSGGSSFDSGWSGGGSSDGGGSGGGRGGFG